jgi:hypothetical protein
MKSFQLDQPLQQQQIEHLKVGKDRVSGLYKHPKPAKWAAWPAIESTYFFNFKTNISSNQTFLALL